MAMQHVVKVDEGRPAADGRPSVGPTYRSAFARDGFPAPVPGLESCYDIFRMAVEKYPNNRMLGRREIVDGKAGAYVWKTYKEVFGIANKIGNSIRSHGLTKGSRCGIYGANSPEWIITMEACNAHGIYCVPLYDTLGAGAIEFILCHAEVEIAFAEEKKVQELLKTFPKSTEFLKTIVSFGNVTQEQKEEVSKYGLSIYSWDEFLSLAGDQEFDLPVKQKTDICTIMYTSGTTGDPKGVLISNASIISLIAGVDRLLNSVNERLEETDVYMSYLPLAHIFDRVVEELFMFHGASIGFWRGDVKLLVEDIGVLKPTILCAVPRVLDRIFSGLQAKISAGGFIKSTMFSLAYKFKQFRMMRGAKHNEAAAICDKVVFSKVKEGLGGNVRVILSGAAPLATHVEEYLRVVTCAHVLQGYGLTAVNRWDFVDLPIFRSQADADDTALAEFGRGARGSFEPTLPPFQLAGPMELWIQDGDDVRLALPHDVDAGTLKKVVLADGAVVTVKGARAVSLRLPLELPLPLNRTTYKGRLSSLLSIARALRGAARSNQKPLLSLRIEGPTSLSSTPSMSPNNKLKLKRLAPGQVELSSRAIPAVTEDEDESHSTGLWPLLSLNGSDGSLQGLEELLASVLGKKAGEKGTFKLLNARASAQTYVKMGFTVEKSIADGEVNWSDFPEWKTKPKKLRAHYEVLARVERGQAIPERIAQVQPFQVDEAMSESMLNGNVSRSKVEVVNPPPVYFTL